MFMHSFWILILLAGMFFLIRSLVEWSGKNKVRALLPGSSSLEILKQRYARGEIDRDEFEQVKRDLEAI